MNAYVITGLAALLGAVIWMLYRMFRRGGTGAGSGTELQEGGLNDDLSPEILFGNDGIIDRRSGSGDRASSRGRWISLKELTRNNEKLLENGDPAKSLDRLFAEAGQLWVCSFCETLNRDDDRFCRACRNKRDK
ncbi:MAG: hypothetical protein II922_09565 [Succinimonas sp.]|nr:hypothetical protein [Succinimonas sp.]